MNKEYGRRGEIEKGRCAAGIFNPTKFLLFSDHFMRTEEREGRQTGEEETIGRSTETIF